MIICSKCSISKQLDEFYDRGDGKKKSYCKKCDNAVKHEYYLNNKDKIKAKTKNWYSSNKEKRKLVSKDYLNTPKGRIVKLLRAAKTRAKQYNHEFSINTNYLLKLWENQNGKCSLTGFAFEFINSTNFTINPFSPSIDRINSSKGYVPGNVRFVCTAVNFALNEFGEEIFKKICEAYISNIKL